MSVSRVGEWSVLGVSAGGDDAVGSVVVPFGVSELSRPVLIGAAQSVDLDHPSGIGSATHRVQRVLATGLSASSVYLTNSATSALEILAIAFRELGYSRAIVPSFAHVADASAFALHGYRIQFADVGDDLLIDPSSVASQLPPLRRITIP